MPHNKIDPKTFYAHAPKQPDTPWHTLDEHLNGVADLAAEFAGAFDSAAWGRIAGLWHDLGKARESFQRYLRGELNKDEGGHSIHGALLAHASSPRAPSFWEPLALVIAGHHGGLANLAGSDGVGELCSSSRSLVERLKQDDDRLAEIDTDTLNIERTAPRPTGLPSWLTPPREAQKKSEWGAFHLQRAYWIRFLFSALVDADFLDTEAYFDRDRATVRGQRYDEVPTLRTRLDAELDRLTVDAEPSQVNTIRAEVLEACRHAAEQPPGVFSLSVPTGGGKTLSSLAFALRHAELHGLRRVIVAIPFTSIIEQNAAVYRKHLGDENTIEHHSNLDPEKESVRNRLASENWDAPVIVTTNVQLFESLHANRPSRCRKLHNIAKSVIVLDEAQALPDRVLYPILDSLHRLVADYGCTIVLCTATQPALERTENLKRGFDHIHEIAPDPPGLARRLSRYDVVWPEKDAEPVTWDELACELNRHESALAIVHRRDDARELAMLVDDSLHLSALMCPAHRSEVLAEVKQRLETKRPCRLVSTQLIEAGVDIDFPVVYRALGGLDSIVQAGGRCNREGRGPRGRLIVFRAPTDPPPGTPKKGLETIEALLDGSLKIDDPELLATYFRNLRLKQHSDSRHVMAAHASLAFADVALRFRMIDDVAQPIVIPWDEEGKHRLDTLRRNGPNRHTLRALQPYTVNLYPKQLEKLHESTALELIAEQVLVLAEPFSHFYDIIFGVSVRDELYSNPGTLIV